MIPMTWPMAFVIVGCALAFAFLCIGVVWGMREEYTVTTSVPQEPKDKAATK